MKTGRLEKAHLIAVLSAKKDCRSFYGKKLGYFISAEKYNTMLKLQNINCSMKQLNSALKRPCHFPISNFSFQKIL